MPNAATGMRLSKWRITYILTLASVIAGVSSYGWYIYTLVRDAERNKPKPQIERLLKDLRTYYINTKQFPANFTEINARIWHITPLPDYGKDGREVRTKNYYYWYTKVNAETCAFWAIPTGSQRHYASSFFVVLAPNWLRVWKGNAKTDEEIRRTPAIPSPQTLAEMQMQEMSAHVSTTIAPSAFSLFLPTHISQMVARFLASPA